MVSKQSALIKNLLALLLGIGFGLGLIVAGMSNPTKVLAFLDVLGDWDPSLAIVMASALGTLIVSQKYFLKNSEPLSSSAASSCDGNRSGVDASLIAGSTLFGLGWGLSGICPGPAFIGLASGNLGSLVFFASMYAGFIAYRWLNRSR
ncbi:MAG: YeeE/YedE family protein [Methylococcaceae bacterium]|nr:YeeE/YedE family protein [Methylococcaceae bacterium]